MGKTDRLTGGRNTPRGCLNAEHPELLHEIDRLIAQALDGDQLVEDRIALEK
jgi:hypothetical protein